MYRSDQTALASITPDSWAVPEDTEPQECVSAPPVSLEFLREHLTTGNTDIEYRRASQAGRELKKWFVPQDWRVSDSPSYVVKIQSFAKGGYEATLRLLDLEKIANAMEPERRFGKRKPPKEIDEDNQRKAAKRAKKKMRYLIRNMAADHLVTLTKREKEGSEYWTEVQWRDAWARLRRMIVRVIGDFPYVVVMERHKKGNFHLHVAWCGRVNVGQLRKMWTAVLGGVHGSGNVDAKYIRVRQGQNRAVRVASYVTKYIAKDVLENARFNKKRYWASKQTLEELRRYVLDADTLDSALGKMGSILGFDLRPLLGSDSVFMFPDWSGLWYSHHPGMNAGADPPF